MDSGYDGTQGRFDDNLVGFGPHGTCGHHVFNPDHPIYTRVALMTVIRKQYSPLRRGRLYARDISVFQNPQYFNKIEDQVSGEILAWSRIFDDQEVLIIINPHGTEKRGGSVRVDRRLSATGMKVVLNTDLMASTSMGVGAKIIVDPEGYISITNGLLGESEIIVLVNESAFRAANPGKSW